RVFIAGTLGTGKSYIARRLALHVASRDERILHVRCHPSLSYDDLVEARLPDGTARPGLVLDFLERARKDRDDRFALVLDDADDADLSRALGELLPALCERGAQVMLPRSRTRFSLPKNLVVLAT